MSAEDDELTGDLAGLLSELDEVTAPPKKAAAKKAQKDETPKDEKSSESPSTPVTPAALTPEMMADIREQLKEEVLAEFRKEKAEADRQREESTLRAIDSKHSGTEQERSQSNPFALPTVEDPNQLPELIHFVADGFTINDRVAYRGQEYKPKDTDTWALLTPREQMFRFGEVKFRIGPWDGAPFDLSDPSLTDNDKKRLQAVMADRLANELKVSEATEQQAARDATV